MSNITLKTLAKRVKWNNKRPLLDVKMLYQKLRNYTLKERKFIG